MPVATEQLLACPPYEINGPAGAPVVVALGGISATRHVCATAEDSSPGWWDEIAGPPPGRALDVSRFQVLGIDYVDGGCRDDGRPEHIVTTHDQARALAAVLDDLAV